MKSSSRWESFWMGVVVSLGCLSWLSLQFGGLGHIPRAIELPGIALTNFLDRVPASIATSAFWPSTVLEGLEGLLDNYQCPSAHEYRVEIVNHEPLILRLLGFLPHGEATHLLTLTNDRSDKSFVSHWTADDPARMYIEPDEDRVVACLEARIANMSGYPIHHQEAIQIVQNSIRRKEESPEDSLWPEWQPFDTKSTQRIARMLIVLDTSSETLDVEFPFLNKTMSIRGNDALFWWNILPDGTFDERISHNIPSTEVWSANVFIDKGYWRPSWWEAS